MSKTTLHSLIAILFVLSGATGLVYQILWFKYLSLFLGNTTYAQTAVLAAFMGGLAIGAAVLGRRADTHSRPLFLYALLEAGIGLYCLLYPAIVRAAKYAFVQLAASLELTENGPALLSLKLTISLVTLLPPTILMGGTLPVLARTISATVEESGRSVAVLYFLNSAGAVVGSILCGFFFIRVLGLSTTMYAAATVNLLIGVAAFALSRQSTPAAGAGSEHGRSARHDFSKGEINIAIVVAGLSGAAAMIYEVTWVRLLIPVLGSSTASFSLMLVAFISGITIGTWVVSKLIDRIDNLFSMLSATQFGVALGLILSLPLYGRIPYIFWHMSAILTKSEGAYPVFLTLEFVVCFLIMIVPTIFAGMTLPVASRIAARSLDRLGSSVGTVFSVNIVGTVIGSLCAGLLLIPAVGVRHAIEAGIAVNMLAGIFVLFVDRRRGMLSKAAIVGLLSAVVVVYFLVASDWSQLVTLSGAFRHVSERQAPPPSFRQFVSGVNEKKDYYYREGPTATVAVIEAMARGVWQRILIINGKGDASSVGDLSTQVLLGQLPMMFHRQADSALVIGLGSGVTVGSILTHPVKSVDCVEISPEVVEASKHFASVNGNALADPRVFVHTEDALTYLQLVRKKYDVIVSEPSNPWIAGIGNLYTTEFFRACKNKLKQEGIMTQWFHIYEIDDDIMKLVTRTFCNVFPQVTVWQTMSDDIVFMGTDSLLTMDRTMSDKFQVPGIRNDLSRIGVVDVPSLLSLQFLSDEQCREYADYGELNTEDKPYLEYASPRAFFLNKGVPEFLASDERPKFFAANLLLHVYTTRRPLTAAEQLAIGMLQGSQWWRNARFAYAMLSEYHRRRPLDQTVVVRLAELTEQLGHLDECLSHWKWLCEKQPDNPVVLAKYAWLKFAYNRPTKNIINGYDAGESERLLRRCVALTADSVDRYHIILGDIYYENQRYNEASEEYLRCAELRKTHEGDPRVPLGRLFAKLAKALYYSGRNAEALAYAVQSSLNDPDNEETNDLIYKIVMKQSSSNSKKTSLQ